MLRITTIFLCVLFLVSCGGPESPSSGPMFTNISEASSGLTFTNTITESDSLNYFTYPYLFLGGGVAAADFDGDGLIDLFFTGNMVGNRLYRNLGNLKFADVTELSGTIAPHSWSMGATVVDINADGLPDIYVCVSGPIGANRANLLFVNEGDFKFVERAAHYGLADTSASVQATSIDYDNDGLLDLLVANYPEVPVSKGNGFYASKMARNAPEDAAHLYRNNGSGKYDLVAGTQVQRFGLSLGLVAGDFSGDGLTDVYVSNDFNVPDYLYLGGENGGFRETMAASLPHTSMFGMGVDIGDPNNDGRPDLFQLDMTPADYKRAKTNMASMRPESFFAAVDMGLHYQYMQNSFQVNRGTDADGVPHFTDVSRMTGTATTDWSWGVLFSDLDNDGQEDIYITNGMKRDVNDNDANLNMTGGDFFGDAQRDYRKLPSHPISNFAFRNDGDLAFTEIQKEWGLDQVGFSNGFVAADLDNDGDLDMAVNNIDAPALLLENHAASNYLSLHLRGVAQNTLALGSKVEITANGRKQYRELTLSRGYLSSQPNRLHFGLGDDLLVDSLVIRWPAGKESLLTDVEANHTITIDQDSVDLREQKNTQKAVPFFKDITARIGLDFRHEEDDFDDWLTEPLLPHRQSRLGPALTVGDLNGDGREDAFFAGAEGQAGAAFRQTAEGTFLPLPGPWDDIIAGEQTGALIFDADGDGDNDLYIVHGGNDPGKPAAYYQDVMYLNTPDGYQATYPTPPTSGQTVAPSDFDGDGDLDLFVGGRLKPGAYPHPGKSYLLRNDGGSDGQLRYKDVTGAFAPELSEVGMVSTAVWADFDGDGDDDLALAGEWTQISWYKNEDGRFQRFDNSTDTDQPVGWWYALAAADIDQDGDMDLVAGNLGRNYKYQADKANPFEVYAADFDRNGREDIVLSKNKGGYRLPLRGRECSSEQVPSIAVRYETFEAFADASLEEIYGQRMLEGALHYAATDFGQYWLENNGDGGFSYHQLPTIAEAAAIKTLLEIDYNQDAYPDFLAAGNHIHAEVETPRSDGAYVMVLLGGADGITQAIGPEVTGLFLTGAIGSLAPLQVREGEVYLVGCNDSPLSVYERR